jgi:hypothetical protein
MIQGANYWFLFRKYSPSILLRMRFTAEAQPSLCEREKEKRVEVSRAGLLANGDSRHAILDITVQLH